MKTITLLLVATVAGSAVLAQDNPPAAPAPSSTASTVAGPAVIRQFIYLARLPTPAELISEAQAQGLTISRIEQGDDRLVVTYQYADGSAQTYAYKLLSSAAGSAPPPPFVENMTVVEAPPPRVVYVEPETVYYSGPRYVRYYDPSWYYQSPISFGINLGYRGGGGYYRGGYSSGGHRGGYSSGGHRGGHGGRRR